MNDIFQGYLFEFEFSLSWVFGVQGWPDCLTQGRGMRGGAGWPKKSIINSVPPHRKMGGGESTRKSEVEQLSEISWVFEDFRFHSSKIIHFCTTRPYVHFIIDTLYNSFKIIEHTWSGVLLHRFAWFLTWGQPKRARSGRLPSNPGLGGGAEVIRGGTDFHRDTRWSTILLLA